MPMRVVMLLAAVARIAVAQCGPADELVPLSGGGKTCRPQASVVANGGGGVAIPAATLIPAITIDNACSGWTLPAYWSCGGNGTISMSAGATGTSNAAASFHSASLQVPGNRLRLTIRASPGAAAHFDVQHCGMPLTALLNQGPAIVTTDYTCTNTDDLQIIPPATSSATITILSVNGSLLRREAATAGAVNGVPPAAPAPTLYTGNRTSELDQKTNRVISLFEGGAGTEWVKQQGSALANDTAHLLDNTQSIRFTSVSPTDTRADKTISLNLTGVSGFRFKVWLDTPANFTGFELWLSNSNFASYFNYRYLPSPLVSGWNDVTMPASLLVGTGSPSLASIDKVRLGCGVAASATVNCTFVGLYAIFNQNPKGTVLFTFDDGFTSTYAVAKAALAQYGWAATEFVIADHVRTAQPGFMTLAQLQDLQNKYGWDIASHTMTHADLPALSAASMDQEFSQFAAWEAANGLNYVPAIAYPQGRYNASVQTEAAKYYLLARSTDLQLPSTAGYLGIYSPLQYQYAMKGHFAAGPPSTTSLATAESWIDDAAANNTIAVIGFHNLTPTPTGSLDWPSSDFNSLVAYAATKNVQVLTFSQLIKQWFH